MQANMRQSLKHIKKLKSHIAKFDPQADNVSFVQMVRSQKPPRSLFQSESEPRHHKKQYKNCPYNENEYHMHMTLNITATSQAEPSEISEDTGDLEQWCKKWQFVMSKILNRDLSLTRTSSINTYDEHLTNDTDIKWSDQDLQTLKEQCLQSFAESNGRMAFAILLNRLRNDDHGLELNKFEFFELANLVEHFCDNVEEHNPMDVKSTKLVMIMTQSLYIRKENILDELNSEEKDYFTTTSQDSNANSETVFTYVDSALPKHGKLFLVDRIKHHPLWKSEAFWRHAYSDSLTQELNKFPTLQRWHSREEHMEADRRNKEITFSQLAAITHNMKEFGMQNSTIIDFLESQNLSLDKKLMLKATLGIYDQFSETETEISHEEFTNPTHSCLNYFFLQIRFNFFDIVLSLVSVAYLPNKFSSSPFSYIFHCLCSSNGNHIFFFFPLFLLLLKCGLTACYIQTEIKNIVCVQFDFKKIDANLFH
ncbi:hypothetical protein RFI_06729 [Reticulomyxa filosa]|uniref:Uncharacterized protein n=1 Tax=Reticulomyxa filosa TaxID=46433 RepID=X6NWQ7_RETFI|nr:hypothetical protein RFI_06729 [Reticulomyxa filosa]|eukprot:ETO30391.1 hypothetical protein RFI_06729 [Reticulomyxa filosa]